VDIDDLHDAIKQLKAELARVTLAIQRLEVLAATGDEPSSEKDEAAREPKDHDEPSQS
jgi:hypothetical protein